MSGRSSALLAIHHLTDSELSTRLRQETHKPTARLLRSEGRRRGWRFVRGIPVKQLTLDDMAGRGAVGRQAV